MRFFTATSESVSSARGAEWCEAGLTLPVASVRVPSVPSAWTSWGTSWAPSHCVMDSCTWLGLGLGLGL